MTHDLSSLHPLNRGIMQTLNIVLIYVFVCAAALSFQLYATGTVPGPTARWVLAAIGGLFVLRAAVQLPLFGAKRLAVGVGVIVVCLLAGGGYVAAAVGGGAA